MFKRLLLGLLLAVQVACGGALQGGTLGGGTTQPPIYTFGIVTCSNTSSPCNDPIVGADVAVNIGPSGTHVNYVHQTTNKDGYTIFTSVLPVSDTVIKASGYVQFNQTLFPPQLDKTNLVIQLQADFPGPPTRDQILDSHESFQGSVLHTTQFGDLNWWPTAFTSLNDVDRAAYYAQAKSWGDTDVTVSVAWDYGEVNQPYGTGQLVPPTDLTGNWPLFRSKVKEVVQKGFVPRIFMNGDNGFNYYMWVMPQVIAILQPQAGDSIDLTQYVKLQMCYDSCVPGWQPKDQVSTAILATRAACDNCVIALEFASGYSSQGDGGAFWTSPGGLALDEADWEGNYWPVTNWDQYWQILARWLGPNYHRPSNQPSGDDPTPPFYLGGGTPRGRFGVQCLEPYTYQWVRGQVDAKQVPLVLQLLQSLGCAVVDSPQ